ncbi:MAG: hypothetical protein OXT67_10325 [Zetaproteobacteria bacterium]|nr:hypothetical protein [Zetaproteobacteria bacterium]
MKNSALFKNGLNRDPRYQLPGELYVMARPFGMKFYNFELTATDISANGMLLISNTLGYIPFVEDLRLNCTFDFQGKTFGRPIHMIVQVKRVGQTKDGKQFFGTRLESIDRNHSRYFERTLSELPILDQRSSTHQIEE